ncbi:hypothetical protein GvMRE_I1g596 [endosymbiont GvMRE of Glomus versiforme]|nr:hypothetical protein GvMRE_I1g596 [endosymbiont GvMRE of Glomus versiforme]
MNYKKRVVKNNQMTNKTKNKFTTHNKNKKYEQE